MLIHIVRDNLTEQVELNLYTFKNQRRCVKRRDYMYKIITLLLKSNDYNRKIL